MAGSVYWVGQDGNIYLKGPGGVKNVGAANGTGLGKGGNYNLSANGFESNTLHQSVQAKQIADPLAPIKAPDNPTGAASSGSGSGSSAAAAPVYDDKSNDIALQNAGLGSVDSQTQTGIDRINQTLATLFGNYDTERSSNNKNYTSNSQENQNQFQAGKQTALVNASTGRQGLLGTLASIGALSGDGITEANLAVQNGANADLAGAGKTYAGNQSSLDTAWNTFTAADDARRKDAQVAADNSITSAKNSGAVAKQTFLTNLANDYAAEGKKDEAATYSKQAADLYPTIASTNIPASAITPQAAAYTPASLASYLSGSNTLVSTTGATSKDPSQAASIPGLSAMTKKQQAPGLVAA